MITKLMIFFLIMISIPSISKAGKIRRTKFSRGFDTYGTMVQLALPISAGIYTLAKKDYKGTINLFEGLVYTQIITQICKQTIKEKRPDGSAKNSFPSGHTMCAMNAAAFMQFHYGSEWGIPYYLLGASVATSRIINYRHNWWDTVASTLIASGIQFLINKKGMSIAPYILGKGAGLSFSKTF